MEDMVVVEIEGFPIEPHHGQIKVVTASEWMISSWPNQRLSKLGSSWPKQSSRRGRIKGSPTWTPHGGVGWDATAE